jgi:hypothetical protein
LHRYTSAVRASCGTCDRRASQPIRAPFVRDRAARDNCGACGGGMSFIARNIAVKVITPATAGAYHLLTIIHLF